jgi:hypothetical protein
MPALTPDGFKDLLDFYRNATEVWVSHRTADSLRSVQEWHERCSEAYASIYEALSAIDHARFELPDRGSFVRFVDDRLMEVLGNA